jgi:hypothetical protein
LGRELKLIETRMPTTKQLPEFIINILTEKNGGGKNKDAM